MWYPSFFYITASSLTKGFFFIFFFFFVLQAMTQGILQWIKRLSNRINDIGILSDADLACFYLFIHLFIHSFIYLFISLKIRHEGKKKDFAPLKNDTKCSIAAEYMYIYTAFAFSRFIFVLVWYLNQANSRRRRDWTRRAAKERFSRAVNWIKWVTPTPMMMRIIHILSHQLRAPKPYKRGMGTVGQWSCSHAYVPASQRSSSSALPGRKSSPTRYGRGNRIITRLLESCCRLRLRLLLLWLLTVTVIGIQRLKLPWSQPSIWVGYVTGPSRAAEAEMMKNHGFNRVTIPMQMAEKLQPLVPVAQRVEDVGLLLLCSGIGDLSA